MATETLVVILQPRGGISPAQWKDPGEDVKGLHVWRYHGINYETTGISRLLIVRGNQIFLLFKQQLVWYSFICNRSCPGWHVIYANYTAEYYQKTNKVKFSSVK